MTLGFDARDIRVLHVDDDAAVLDLVAELLESTDERIQVQSESDPTSVLKRLETEQIDCIVSDYNMPGLDGIALCRAVRDQYPDLPFILFSSEKSEDLITKAFAAGVTEYTHKKSGVGQYSLLSNRIQNAVSRRRALCRLEH